ncbi:thymidylate synthase [Neorhizobium huautlense]|uniref:thymidylate synthase n=1 Tax=Neorhizobium huautlense TaxID=67774 RepID=A0ABT9PT95_9HYPH|nr:thymidylate synthase [Neorhizobium huautlense]MDP9837690.1 thymidylate synthase [Neorhizobium huautlense]
MRFDNANDMLAKLAGYVLTNGTRSAPRGSGTIETLGVSFTLTNPLAREITLASRKFSLPLALGELGWHIRGDDDVEALAYYAGAWRNFTDDGERVAGSCYGRKLMAVDASGSSAWQRLVSLFKHDPSTRRATFSFINNDEDLEKSKDISCVSSIQFLLRNGRLDLFTFMRSNDLFLGVPYDVFLFTYMQELMSLDLNVELGEYHHYATSLHIYDKHVEDCRRIAEDRSSDEGLSIRSRSRGDLVELATAEAVIRNTGSVESYNGPFKTYVEELLAFREKKDAWRSHLAS